MANVKRHGKLDALLMAAFEMKEASKFKEGKNCMHRRALSKMPLERHNRAFYLRLPKENETRKSPSL